MCYHWGVHSAPGEVLSNVLYESTDMHSDMYVLALNNQLVCTILTELQDKVIIKQPEP